METALEMAAKAGKLLIVELLCEYHAHYNRAEMLMKTKTGPNLRQLCKGCLEAKSPKKYKL
jgi:ankyrin repeat protein